jgi:hypothetical protein
MEGKKPGDARKGDTRAPDSSSRTPTVGAVGGAQVLTERQHIRGHFRQYPANAGFKISLVDNVAAY